MRLRILCKPGIDGGPAPTPQHIQEMGQLIGEMAQAAILIATHGLQESRKGVRVRIEGSPRFDRCPCPQTSSNDRRAT